MSLDDIIKADRSGGRSGGAMRKEKSATSRRGNTPYSAGPRKTGDVEKRGRGNFRYGNEEGGGKGARPGATSASANTSVYVGNLPFSVDWRTLKEFALGR